MVERDIVVSNPSGLHARPASVLVQAAQRFGSTIRLSVNGNQADAKSILDVLTLGAERDARIHVVAEGPDEADAVSEIERLVAGGLGEGS